jgi:hypothetical protein
MPQRGEFRATTDQMITLIDRLRGAEERKRRLPMGSPEFVDSARETVEIAQLVFRWSQMQLEMALSAESRVSRGENGVGVELIDVESRPIDRILANWREAQLRLEIAPPGSVEAESAASDIERFREEYQAAHELRMAADDATLATAPGELTRRMTS